MKLRRTATYLIVFLFLFLGILAIGRATGGEVVAQNTAVLVQQHTVQLADGSSGVAVAALDSSVPDSYPEPALSICTFGPKCSGFTTLVAWNS